MYKLESIEKIIYKLISREFDMSDFESWVYSEKGLENLLSNTDYLELVSLNYTKPSAAHDAEAILQKYIRIEKYHNWHLQKILKKIIDRPSDVHKYITQTYELYCDGFGFLESIGIGYGLSIEVPPSPYNAQSWKELPQDERELLIDSFYPSIEEEAKKIINWLNSKQIVLTGHTGNFQGIEYKDFRIPD